MLTYMTHTFDSVFRALNLEICEHKEEIYMSSSCVMFVFEFEFPIE